ncbi:hypothetical protein Q7P37_008592 [Cladosporium fusiforme]
MSNSTSIINEPDLALDRQAGNIFIITMRKAPENRINSAYAQKLIGAFNLVRKTLGTDSEGAVITRGNDAKFWCTGLELSESDSNPSANSEGFYPLLATILDFPFPTIALITGHTFGGACPLALSHDYRIMNSQRGYISMPPINLGLHFPGIGSLLRLKLSASVARKMLLQAHRWTGEEALADGIVDFVAAPGELEGVALGVARMWAPKAKMGVYALLRGELYGEAARGLREISYVFGRRGGFACEGEDLNGGGLGGRKRKGCWRGIVGGELLEGDIEDTCRAAMPQARPVSSSSSAHEIDSEGLKGTRCSRELGYSKMVIAV